MKIEDFGLWDMEHELTEGCEIKCPKCDEWSKHTEWTEGEIACDDCGSHSAIICPKCEEYFDHVKGEEFIVREAKEEKTFVFHVSKSPGHSDRIEKKESELTSQEEAILYGQLLQAYSNNTRNNQLRFLQDICNQAKTDINAKMYEELNNL